MGMYKTGHTQNASLNVYTQLIDKHGHDSSEASDYLEQFKNDIVFVKQAEAVREGYLKKTADNHDKNGEI